MREARYTQAGLNPVLAKWDRNDPWAERQISEPEDPTWPHPVARRQVPITRTDYVHDRVRNAPWLARVVHSESAGRSSLPRATAEPLLRLRNHRRLQ
jgi:hypothetical protein